MNYLFVEEFLNVQMGDNRCIIETNNGRICGYIDRTADGTYYKFKRIPYAKPPLGNLRFMVRK